jgi:hypothetical protein
MHYLGKILVVVAALAIVQLTLYGAYWFMEGVSKEAERIEKVIERNEWGQLPQTRERMCAATIKQWSEWCND